MRVTDIFLNTPPRQFYYLLLKRFSGTALQEFNDRNPCIFVLSTGRVGSMTLANLLALCRNLIAFHEPKPSLYRMSKAAYQYPSATQIEVWQEVFWSLRDDLIGMALQRGRGYVETSPQATFLAPVIAQAIPNVRFLHLVRHPAAVIRSGMRRDWYAGHPADGTRIVPRADSELAIQWETMTPFQKNAWLWSETNRWIIEFTKTLPPERRLILRSEDLYRGEDKAIQSLFQFCGSTSPSKGKINRILSLRLNRQHKGQFPEFKDWSPEMHIVLRDIASGIAAETGYSLKMQ